jgi:hypothetical protein
VKKLIVILSIVLSGCASTQKAPENLDKYSSTTKASFVAYKNTVKPHRAFAVAKFKRRDFFGFGYSYPTIEQAEKRALDECHSRALKFRDEIQCFIYHSE